MISGQGLVRKSDIYPTPVSTINLPKAEHPMNKPSKNLHNTIQYNTIINLYNTLSMASKAHQQVGFKYRK
jgi:hypothetical protein